MKLCPVAVVLIVGGCCLAKPYHDDHYSPLGIAGATSVSSSVSESTALNHTSSHNFESSTSIHHHIADVGGKLAKISTTIKKTTSVRRVVRKRKRSKSTYRTQVSSGVIPQELNIPAAAGTSGYKTNFIDPAIIASEVSPKGYSQNSKIQAADSVSETNSQEASNKGYTRTGASYPVYAGTYSEAGYDQKSKSAYSSKASRSLSQESARNGFNNRVLVAPEYGGAAGYSDSSSTPKVQSSAPRFVAAPEFVEH